MQEVQIEGHRVWCVRWQSPTNRGASYWYFDQESEAALAHQRLVQWTGTQSSARGRAGGAERE
jgi:hypothetical protein